MILMWGFPFRQNHQPFPFRAGRCRLAGCVTVGDPDEVAKAGLLQALQDHPGGTASHRHTGRIACQIFYLVLNLVYLVLNLMVLVKS